MNRYEFSVFIADLADYYGSKHPSEKTTDLWYEAIGHIKADALPWIRSRLTGDCDVLPKNVPKVVRELYEAWQQTNKADEAVEVDCPDCEGGWLALEANVPNYKTKISYSAACGKCRQVKTSKYMTLSEAIGMGYERVNLRSYPTNNRNMRGIVKMVAK